MVVVVPLVCKGICLGPLKEIEKKQFAVDEIEREGRYGLPLLLPIESRIERRVCWTNGIS